jgi:F0F1-type ATP synthase membrane subunit b/b'
VTVVTDDSTGIWQVGEIEKKVCIGPLRDFLDSHGEKGAEEVKAMLEHLKTDVDRELRMAREEAARIVTKGKE